jgi:hypothetical protein
MILSLALLKMQNKPLKFASCYQDPQETITLVYKNEKRSRNGRTLVLLQSIYTNLVDHNEQCLLL